MVSELPEAVEYFLSLCHEDSFADRHVFARELSVKLHAVEEELVRVQSRFIDLDPSAKLITDDEALRFRETVAEFLEEALLREDLLNLYEILSLYKLLRERFGEAADWYLKNEYDHREKALFTRVLTGLGASQ